MRPLLVDVTDLEGFAQDVGSLAGRLEAATGLVRAAATAPAAGARGGAGLADVVRQCAEAVARLRALAFVVSLVARRYSTVEAELAASFGPGRSAASALLAGPVLAADVAGLLALAGPTRLGMLLIAAPALARLVVDGEATGAARDVPGIGRAELAALVSAVTASRRPGLAGREAWLADQRRAQALFAALGPRRLGLLALLRPQLVSSAPSAPLEARFAASRVLVAADLDVQLRRQGAAPPGPARAAVARQVAQRREWLAGSVSLRGPEGRERRQPHRLLRFDPRGDGQVVELLGEPRTARHLAVVVPGTGSDLERYPGTLARASALAAADPRLAVVVWQGADFPDQPFDDGVLPLREHVLAAAYRDSADVAGPRLAADVEGLRVAAPGPGSDVTLLGHSYGAAVVGSAEANGMVADRVVYVAGAGTYAAIGPGTATDATGPLDAHVTRRYSLTAYDDSIRLAQGYDLSDAAGRWRAMAPGALDPAAPLVARTLRLVVGDPAQVGLGPDPDLVPGVVRLDPGVFDDGRPVRGHSAMWTPGSTAWRNLLATANGAPVSVLEPQRWSSHLEPAQVGVGAGGVDVRWPRYVVDRTPWDDPAYRPPRTATR